MENFREKIGGWFASAKKKEVIEKPRDYQIMKAGENLMSNDGEHNYEARGIGKVSSETSAGGPGSKYGRENQDHSVLALSHDGNRMVFGAIDGAGGSNNGELASRIVSEEIIGEFVGRDGVCDLERALAKAESRISKEAGGGYATAVVGSIENGGRVLLANVGDTKAMTIRGGKKLEEGTTRMHNLAAQMHGESTSRFFEAGNKNVITKAVGLGSIKTESSKADFFDFQGQNGDIMVLASDGLWDLVSEYEVEHIVKEKKGFGAAAVRHELMRMAYSRNNSRQPFQIEYAEGLFADMAAQFGKGDNITVQVVEINTPEGKAGNVEQARPDIDREKFLSGTGDVKWLKFLMKDGRNIPVRRSNGDWNNGVIRDIDDYSLTATVAFTGGHYDDVPLEAIVSWCRDSGNYSKVHDMYPNAVNNGLERKILRQVKEDEKNAVEKSGMVKYFEQLMKDKKDVILRCLDKTSDLSDWFRCQIMKVDAQDASVKIIRAGSNTGLESRRGQTVAEHNAPAIEDIPMSAAYSHLKEAEWTGLK